MLGLLILCIIVVVGGGSVLLANEANATPVPTAITTCEGLLKNVHSAYSANKNIKTDKKYILNVYQVEGDQISGMEKGMVPTNLLKFQDDLESQILIWDYFASIIPPEQRRSLTEYRIFTDGSGNIAGYADIKLSSKNESATETMALEVDLAGYQDLNSINDTLVHEFGHMLTLNNRQIDIKTDPTRCLFYTTAGQCSFGDSYLNRFFEQFRKREPDEERETGTPDLREEIADSWTNFVMEPRPTGNRLSAQKILFFYNFPELVSLRSAIRGRICKYFNMPE